jgi:hypothetical protein
MLEQSRQNSISDAIIPEQKSTVKLGKDCDPSHRKTSVIRVYDDITIRTFLTIA